MSHHGREGLTEEQSFGSVPSPPAAPELPDRLVLTGYVRDTLGGDYFIYMDGLLALLATQGLSIVDAKNRAVLDAWGPKCISDECLAFIARNGSGPVCQCARAELARRKP